MQPVADIIPCKEYQGDHKKLKGIKALYFKYCYALGIIRPKESKQHYPSPQFRKDLIYMDKITNENTFAGKHNLETLEDVLACIIFSAFASSPPVVDTTASSVSMIWSYIGELIFNMLVLVGTIKMSDRIVKEMMGL